MATPMPAQSAASARAARSEVPRRNSRTCAVIGLDWIGLDWIGLDWIGLDWIGLDWIGLDWIGLDWITSRVGLAVGRKGRAGQEGRG